MTELRTWSQAVSLAYSSYMLSLKARRLSANTIDFYERRLPPFLTAAAVAGIDEITPHHVRAYLAGLHDRSLSAIYIHNIASAIRAFLRFCVAEGIIATSPMAAVQMPKLPRQTLPAFAPDEVKRLIRHAGHPRDAAIVLMLLDTGLRASEILALNGADLEIAGGVVHVRGGKGGKDRDVFVGSRTLRALLRYYNWRGVPAATGPVWVSLRTRRRLTTSGLRRILGRLGEAANVPHCHPHTFRRTFALTCLRNGMNIYVLQRLMGHEDIGILRQYLALVETDLRTAQQRFGVVDNL